MKATAWYLQNEQTNLASSLLFQQMKENIIYQPVSGGTKPIYEEKSTGVFLPKSHPDIFITTVENTYDKVTTETSPLPFYSKEC